MTSFKPAKFDIVILTAILVVLAAEKVSGTFIRVIRGPFTVHFESRTA